MSTINVPVPMSVSVGMTSGATVLKTDKVPYLSRASEADAADAAFDKIIGGTIAWNQLVPITAIPTTEFADGFTITNNSDGTITLNGTTSSQRSTQYVTVSEIANHVYLISGAYVQVRAGSSSVAILTPSEDVTIIKPSNSPIDIRVRVVGDTSISNLTITPQVFDLTQKFGSGIADYIYTLEQSTAGSGVAWFKKLFLKDYYAYNPGELLSVKTSAHVLKDQNNNVLKSYPLDSDIELRGIPKLDANNNLYYDGDAYDSDGTVTRKYDVVDLGELTWSKYNVTQGTLFRSSEISGAKIITGLALANIICSKYVTVIAGRRAENTISCSVENKVDIIDSTYADSTVAQFKAAMSGEYLLYELETQTTEPADPYDNPQAVYADGLEEYVDERDVPIPVGHETKYVARQTTETAFDAYPMTVTQGVEV